LKENTCTLHLLGIKKNKTISVYFFLVKKINFLNGTTKGVYLITQGNTRNTSVIRGFLESLDCSLILGKEKDNSNIGLRLLSTKKDFTLQGNPALTKVTQVTSAGKHGLP